MILALDPGTTETAYLFMDNGEICISDVIKNNDIRDVLFKAHYSELIIEEIRCYGMGVGKEVYQTVTWCGRFAEIAIQRNIPVHWVGRKEVTTFWCGSPKATDANLNAALQDHYGKKGTKNDPGPMYGLNQHTRSALAIAGFWFETHNKQLTSI